MGIAELGSWWENAAGVLAVLGPLVAVPLTVLGLQLRAIRSDHAAGRGELLHHIDALRTTVEQLRACLVQYERDYTTKEEWLRETMAARRHIERLSEAVVRLDTEVKAPRRTRVGGVNSAGGKSQWPQPRRPSSAAREPKSRRTSGSGPRGPKTHTAKKS